MVLTKVIPRQFCICRNRSFWNLNKFTIIPDSFPIYLKLRCALLPKLLISKAIFQTMRWKSTWCICKFVMFLSPAAFLDFLLRYGVFNLIVIAGELSLIMDNRSEWARLCDIHSMFHLLFFIFIKIHRSSINLSFIDINCRYSLVENVC